MNRRYTIPNALSAARLLIAPFLLWLAWTQQKPQFLILMVVSLLTDLVDGTLARRLRQESTFGTRLDSWGDLANYLCLPLCSWWLWPDLIRREALFVVLAIGAYVVPTIIGLLRFGRLTCYHTWGAKASALLIGVSVPVLLLELTPWPFRLSVPVLVLTAIEDTAITFILPRWRPNVPSFVHALRSRESERPERT